MGDLLEEESINHRRSDVRPIQVKGRMPQVRLQEHIDHLRSFFSMLSSFDRQLQEEDRTHFCQGLHLHQKSVPNLQHGQGLHPC